MEIHLVFAEKQRPEDEAATVNLGYSSQTDAFIAYFEKCFQTSPISLVQFVFLFVHDSHE